MVLRDCAPISPCYLFASSRLCILESNDQQRRLILYTFEKCLCFELSDGVPLAKCRVLILTFYNKISRRREKKQFRKTRRTRSLLYPHFGHMVYSSSWCNVLFIYSTYPLCNSTAPNSSIRSVLDYAFLPLREVEFNFSTVSLSCFHPLNIVFNSILFHTSSYSCCFTSPMFIPF